MDGAQRRFMVMTGPPAVCAQRTTVDNANIVKRKYNASFLIVDSPLPRSPERCPTEENPAPEAAGDRDGKVVQTYG